MSIRKKQGARHSFVGMKGRADDVALYVGFRRGGPPNANDNDGSEDTNTLESGLFGVLYT